MVELYLAHPYSCSSPSAILHVTHNLFNTSTPVYSMAVDTPTSGGDQSDLAPRPWSLPRRPGRTLLPRRTRALAPVLAKRSRSSNNKGESSGGSSGGGIRVTVEIDLSTPPGGDGEEASPCTDEALFTAALGDAAPAASAAAAALPSGSGSGKGPGLHMVSHQPPPLSSCSLGSSSGQ